MRLAQFATLPALDRGRLETLHFGPDGQSFAAVWRIEENILLVRWWDLRRHAEAGAEFGASMGEDDFTPPEPALSPDHRFLARTANERGGVQFLQVLDRAARKPRWRDLTAWPYTEYGGDPEGFNYQNFDALAFTPDGQYLVAAVGGGDPEDDALDAPRLGLYRWRVEAILRGRGPKSGGRLLPDPKFFLNTPQRDVVNYLSFGRRLAFTPDGSALAAGLWNDRILGWELPSGRALPAPRLKKRGYPTAWRLAYHPDGQTLAAADATVTLYDTATGKPRAVLPLGPPVVALPNPKRAPTVFDLAYDPSGQLLATACGDARVRWWDGTTGQPRQTFDWKIGPVTAVTFSPDGCLCAAGGADGQVAVWDVDG